MSGFTVTVGFTSSNWKTYDDQLAADEKSMTSSESIKVDGTIGCNPSDTNVAPEVIEACKSIRAYPKMRCSGRAARQHSESPMSCEFLLPELLLGPRCIRLS